MLDKAIRIAAQAFEGKFDKGGHPYVLHCIHVMNSLPDGADEDTKCATVLHDLFEDCPEWTPERVFQEGISHSVILLMSILTHHPESETYMEYIQNISNYKSAVMIKLADLRHNSDITRMKDVRKKDFDRLQKYHIAYKYLGG